MEIKQALEILKDHQKWRRAEWEYTSVWVKSKYTPKHLWKKHSDYLQ